MIRPVTTKLDLAEKQQAIVCGGFAAIVEFTKTLGLPKELNRSANVLKLHLHYDEADLSLNIALNLLTSGTCLDHIEHRRNDKTYLDALRARHIPGRRQQVAFVVSPVIGTGLSLSCCGETVSVRIAGFLHEFVLLLPAFEFARFTPSWSMANGKLRNRFK